IEDLERDHELLLTSRRHPADGPHRTRTAAPYAPADLTSLDDCRRIVAGVDAVAHIGAIGHPTPDTYRTNTLSTYYLLEAMREAGVRHMVYASSNCALGHCFRTSGHVFEARYFPFDEQHPSALEENYGLSKKASELSLEAYTRAYGFVCYALRLNWCWGERELALRSQQPFDAARHTGGFWAYVDMRDVAQAFRRALERPIPAEGHYGSYFISADDTMADEESAALVERFYPHYRDLAATLSGHQSFFSWQAAQRDFGYAPQHSWRA
ncbi:MAG: NAD(P)-dependent oxidoreductase, partial [Chloroflexales bacterium]|nr:NAD(P)-dependent oxidoreductase [Chloroflexales bacterium]